MRRTTGAWALAGLLAGAAGLAVSYLITQLMSERLTPVSAVAELVSRLTPGSVVHWAIDTFGTRDKPLLIAGILVVLVGLFLVLGRLARRSLWAAYAGFGLLAGVGATATMTANGAAVTDLLPLAAGLATWIGALAVFATSLRRLDAVPELERFEPEAARTRRRFLLTTAGVAVGAGAATLLGRVAGRGRERVEQARRLLRLDVTPPRVPAGATIGVEGVAPWQTPTSDFYLIDTAFTKPTIEPRDWQLRIHGMVEREVVLTYADLVRRPVVERWITLNCVSNEVGGDLVGNAWWSGVALAPLLEMAGPLDGADAVLQTSQDGWNCGTPLEALVDGEVGAMLAVAMNGEPLPIEHGFPVRTLVPGLYGYVSACKWVVDLEVTRFADIEAYWTQRGWGERGPVKIASRIDVPRPGTEFDAGEVVVAGSAWKQHTGIAAVEIAVDGGAWTPAEVASAPNDDSWVQWRAAVTLEPGDHQIRVRATGKDGDVQTGAVADVLPDGATGWDSVDLTVRG
ncbi:molybdopterin-dependent oxidoreductase [Nocardioides sp. R-C-SC26]|uniref:molybdopterin-dependent oxidoreductase n=1 Tax=Nocardioides sp. R-C-SC26 TaxID=2870414 RepID=UPI001E53F7F2|nr:molybdopterin-dependent oxidoreductase [Nocardioides sp. R-C-SC26]